MALVGVHPVLTQVPPKSLRSAKATFMPEVASRLARAGPACPAPMTIASKLFAMGVSLHEFEQDAASARRMNKDVTMTARAGFDFPGDEPDVPGFQACDGGGKIGDPQTDVVEALSAFGNKFCDGRVVRSGLEKFEAACAEGDH